jgi:hypothetical protein
VNNCKLFVIASITASIGSVFLSSTCMAEEWGHPNASQSLDGVNFKLELKDQHGSYGEVIPETGKLVNADATGTGSPNGIPPLGNVRRPSEGKKFRNFVYCKMTVLRGSAVGCTYAWTLTGDKNEPVAAKFSTADPGFAEDAVLDGAPLQPDSTSGWLLLPGGASAPNDLTVQCVVKRGTDKRYYAKSFKLQKPTGLKVTAYAPGAYSAIAPDDPIIPGKGEAFTMKWIDSVAAVKYKVQPENLEIVPCAYLREGFLPQPVSPAAFADVDFFAWRAFFILFKREGFCFHLDWKAQINNKAFDAPSYAFTDMIKGHGFSAPSENAGATFVKVGGVKYDVKTVTAMLEKIALYRESGVPIETFTQDWYVQDIKVATVIHQYIIDQPRKLLRPGTPPVEIAIGDVLSSP